MQWIALSFLLVGLAFALVARGLGREAIRTWSLERSSARADASMNRVASRELAMTLQSERLRNDIAIDRERHRIAQSAGAQSERLTLHELEIREKAVALDERKHSETFSLEVRKLDLDGERRKLEQRRVELEERMRADSVEVPLPDDLRAVANQWDDEWAREDMRGSMREKFKAYRDEGTEENDAWNLVRRAYGVGTIDSPAGDGRMVRIG